MRRMPAWSVVAGSCLATALVPFHGVAQTMDGVSVGIQAAYNFSDLNEPGLGGHALIGLPAGFGFYPAAQSYFVESGSLWRVSTSLRWMPRATSLTPYVAAGAYWSRSSTGGVAITDMGILGQVGAEARLRNLRPFAEVQFLKDGAVSAEMVAGLRFIVTTRR